VTLTSGNWQPGEWVVLYVNDNIGQTWSITTNKQADENGAWTYQFNLPNWFVATYHVTATGEVSGVATADFTDASSQITGKVINDVNGNGVDDSEPGLAGAIITIYKDKTSGGGIQPGIWDGSDTIQAGPFTTTSTGLWDSGNMPADNTYFVVETDPTSYTSTSSIKGTDSSSSTTTIVSNNQFKVVIGNVGGSTLVTSTNNKFLDKATCTAPSITLNPLGVSIDYGNDSTFSAAASGSPAPTLQWQVSTNGGSTFTDLAGQTSSPLTLTTPTVSQSGNQYRAVFTNTCGSVNSTSASLTVNKATTTITWNNPADITYGTALSGTQLNATTSVPGSFTYTPASGTVLNAGNGQILHVAFTPSDTTNYNSASKDVTINVLQRTLTVTADPQTKTYGNADPSFTYQVTSGSLVSSDSFSGSLGRASGENVGTYAINQGTLTAGNNYSITFVGANLTISARAIAVKADDKNKTYGDIDPTLTYTITSGSLAYSDTFNGSLTRDPGESFGSYDIDQGSLSLSSNYSLSFTKGMFTIAKRAVTVTADPQTKVYGDADPALSYAVTSGSLASGDSFSGAMARAAGENVGSYAIGQGTLALNSNYVLTFVGANLTITARPIAVKADAQTKVYGQTDPSLSYQITSGTLFGSDAFSGALVRAGGEDVGTYAINQGTLALSSNYDLTYVGANFTITQATLTVTAADKSKTYGQDDPAFTFSYSGFQFSDDASVLDMEPTCSVSGVHKNVGSYNISCSGGSDSNYSFSYVNGTLMVGQAILTVKADNQTVTYGDSDPSFTFSYSGFQYSDGVGDLDVVPVCSVMGAHTDADSYTISCSGGSDGNYSFSYVNGTFTVNQRPITVKADPQTKVYGQADPEFTYQITSGSLVNGDDFSGLLSRDAGQNVGTYAIKKGTLTLGGNYNLTFVSDNLAITPATLTVVADPQTKVYGDSDPALSYIATGFQFSDTSANVLTGGLARVSGENIGSYAINQGSLVANSNYAISFTGDTLVITKRPIIVTADAQTKVYGNADPSLTYQITSGSLAYSDAFTGALTRAAGENVGTYAISKGTLALSNNYDLSFVGADLTITQRAITVAAEVKTKVYGDADPALTYQITSGSLAFSDAFTGVLTRASGEIVGTYSITQGTLVLSSNYVLTYVGANLTITKATLTVKADDKSKFYGDPDPIFTFVYSGFKFSDTATVIDTAPSCTVTVAHTAVGSYPITCSGGLDNNYSFSFVNGTLTIGSWTGTGFYQPVDMNGVVNTVKGGSTVPLKFELFAGTTELTNTSAVQPLMYSEVSCTSLSGTTDDIETLATGSTVLRYDTTAGQFIYNWKTPSYANRCFRVTMTASDNVTKLIAYFRTK
jgi:hypothetical protein